MNTQDPLQTGSVDAPTGAQAPAADPAAPGLTAGDPGGAPSGGAPVGSALAVPDDHLFEVKYGKESLKVPFAELKSGYQRHKDYTQKTMQLAEQRRQYEEGAQRWQTEKEQLRTYLSSAENVRKILTHLERTGQIAPGSAAAAAGATEEEFLTTAQARQMFEQERAQYTRATEARLAREREDYALSQQAASYSVEIDTTIKGLLDSHPELQAVDDIESLLRQDAAKLQPQTMDEAKQYMVQAAQARASKIQAWHTERAKQAAANQAQLKNGIEPPSSTPGIMPVGASPTKLKLGDPRLKAEALAELNAMLSQQ